MDAARSFFGILRVEDYGERQSLLRFEGIDPEDGEKKLFAYPYDHHFYKLSHGTTLHGMQSAETATYPLRDDLQAARRGVPVGRRCSSSARRPPGTSARSR